MANYGRAGCAVIRTLRHALGMTQEQLAERLGVTQALVSHWELGRNWPPADRVRQLALMAEEAGVTDRDTHDTAAEIRRALARLDRLGVTKRQRGRVPTGPVDGSTRMVFAPDDVWAAIERAAVADGQDVGAWLIGVALQYLGGGEG